jgi:hypothetical protein
MLIIALVLALIGLVALVFAVVTSNELVAWVCIGASVLGVVLLIIDALRERQQSAAGGAERGDEPAANDEGEYVDYPEEVAGEPPATPDAADSGVTESFEETGTEAGVPADGRDDDPAK